LRILQKENGDLPASKSIALSWIGTTAEAKQDSSWRASRQCLSGFWTVLNRTATRLLTEIRKNMT